MRADPRLISYLLLLAFGFAAGQADSNDSDYLTELITTASGKNLYAEKAWLALGHYRPDMLGLGFRSEADDKRFFFSENGKTAPKAELIATLRSFFQISEKKNHPQCRFPARYHWLNQQLSFDKNRLDEKNCTQFELWRDQIKAETATLIFPAAYLNSPSSMFGHTFLRLDQGHESNANKILSFTINYAADANARDDEFSFAVKGVFGGYPGIVSIQPYYQKIKEYSDLENRDIWEYQLNFTADEIDQLVKHVWEIKDIRFDYFFIDENCSYRILSLLEVARPSFSVTDQFSLRAIPADTIRSTVTSGLVVDVNYRPSAATILRHHIEQLGPDQQKLAINIAEQGIESRKNQFQSLDELDRAAVLEIAYEHLHYHYLKQRIGNNPETSKKLHRLLLARSKLPVISPFLPVPIPKTRDDEGHQSSRIGFGVGQWKNDPFISINYRSAYHGLTDPSQGYQQGAQIEWFQTSGRLYKKGRFQLEQLTVLDITSFTPRNRSLTPVSWSVSLGARRTLLDGNRPLVGFFNGSGGVAYKLGDSLGYSLIETSLEVADVYKDSIALGAGFRFGILYQIGNGQGNVEFSHLSFVAGETHDVSKISLEHSFTLSPNNALRLSVSRERSDGDYANEFEIGLSHYF